MRKLLLAVIILLLTMSVCFAQNINYGIKTRTASGVGTLDSAQSDTTEIIIPLGIQSEQGYATLVLFSDTTDTFNVWYSSGCYIKYFGARDTAWSTRVQCVWDGIIGVKDAYGPINIPFLQSENLVDTTDWQVGYMPADFLRISVAPGGDADVLDTVTENEILAKVWFK